MAEIRAKVHFWTEGETLCLIKTLKEFQILKYMDGRKTRNGDLFKKVSEELLKAKFTRSAEQVRVRWKALKTAYYRAKRANEISGHDPQTSPFYSEMNELLGHRPLSTVEDRGVDVGFSQPSQEPAKDPDTDDVDVDDGAVEVDVETVDQEMQESSGTSNQATVSLARVQRKRRPQGTVAAWEQQLAFFQEQDRRQQEFITQQAQISAERQERLVGAILDSNTRMMSVLMEGLQALRQPPPMPLQPPQHFYQGYYPGPGADTDHTSRNLEPYNFN